MNSSEIRQTGCCQLCGDKVENIEVGPHTYCTQYEIMWKDYSIIGLLESDGDGEAEDVTRKRDGLYVWVTWLSRLLVGETCCQWSAWFKTHHTDYQKAPSDFQLAIWTAQHTEMVDKIAKEHLASGKKVFREEQNWFKVRRGSGLLIAGKPDLITIDGVGQHIVLDAKTGSPRNSDTIQVMLYMMLLPYSQPIFKGKEFEGCVVYRDGKRYDIPAAAIDDDFKKRVSYFLNILESTVAPVPTPSFAECKFCDIGDNDCSNRCQTNVPKTVDEAEPNIPF